MATIYGIKRGGKIPNKSPGPNGIHPKALKELARY